MFVDQDEQEIINLLGSSVSEAASELNCMLHNGQFLQVIELVSAALIHLNDIEAVRMSYRKILASAARKAIRHLEAGGGIDHIS